jgi:superfamily I DNA/RNA helicase
MYRPPVTTTLSPGKSNNNNIYKCNGIQVWKLKDDPLNPRDMDLNNLGKPNRNSKRRKYFAKEAPKKRHKKSFENVSTFDYNHIEHSTTINITTTTTTAETNTMVDVVDLTKLDYTNRLSGKKKPPSAKYVRKGGLKNGQPLSSCNKNKFSETRNAATPGGGFLLTPISGKNIDNNNNKHKSHKNYQRMSPVPTPVFYNSPALQNNKNANQMNIDSDNKNINCSSQPRINDFFEKSIIKWDGDSNEKKNKKKKRRSLIADAASGILRSSTSSGRRANYLLSPSASSSSSPFSNPKTQTFFSGFANKRKDKKFKFFLHHHQTSNNHNNISRSLHALSSTSHNKHRRRLPTNSNGPYATTSYQKQQELKMPDPVSSFNVDNVVDRADLIFPSGGTDSNSNNNTNYDGLSVRSYAQNLSYEQKRAVTTPLKRPSIITAGPGSGKTRTLISRLCYLIDCGADPKSCIAFTFTRDATNEIKERTEQILGEAKANQITIKNFHSFALKILLRHGKEYDILNREGTNNGGLSVINEKEQYEYVATACARINEIQGFSNGNIMSFIPQEATDCAKGLYDDDDVGKADGLEDYLSRDLKLWDTNGWGATSISKGKSRIGFDYPLVGKDAPNPDCVAHFLKYIKLAKAQCKYPVNLHEEANMTPPSSLLPQVNPAVKKRNQLYLDVYSAYEELLDLNHKIDYSDFIPGVIHLFEMAPGLKEKYKQIYQFVFVDEFQDLNLPQITLLQMLCEDGRITVCGDPDQSIYGFRGAYGALGFTMFKNYWNEYHETDLKINYRSVKEIINCSVQLIENNLDENGKKKSKDIYQGIKSQSHSGNDEIIGKRVKTFLSSISPRSECEKIASFIKLKRFERGCSYSNFAILARSLQVVCEIEKALVKHKIPIDGIHCRPTIVNGKVSYASNIQLLDSPTCYFFRRLGRLLINDIANDECLDILSPQSTVCPFQINKDTIDTMNFFVTNYDLTYIMAARDMVELHDEISKECHSNASSSTTNVIIETPPVELNANDDGILSDDEDKEVMKHKITLLDHDQIKCLKFFVDFVDKLRTNMKTMTPNNVLHAMIKGSKFHKSLKRKHIGEYKQYYDGLSALDNHAIEFTNSWDGMVNYPDRKGRDVFEKWLDELDMHILTAKQNKQSDVQRGGGSSKIITKRNAKGNKANSTDNISNGMGQADVIDAVTVTTIHRAKGREWPTVIIARMNEGVFPVDNRTRKHLDVLNNLVNDGGNSTGHHRQKQQVYAARHEGEDAGIIEEERRLAYVAMTRASDELILSCIRRNGDEFMEPSRFLDEAL